MQQKSAFIAAVAATVTCLAGASAQADDAKDLATQLSNPVSSLISVPFQYNYDEGYGANDGHRNLVNFQPVVPFSISENWNVISRTIVPFIEQTDIAGPSGTQSGTGDTVQSFFFSPKNPGPGGVIWGVGPAFNIPTASDDMLGSGKWAVGPTGVVLVQKHGWTYGALANHLWSFAGDDDRSDINNTYLQPLLSYTTDDAWSFTVNSESNYNWETEEWSVPFNFMVAKVVKMGEQPVSLQVGARYWADTPESGPEGWGARAAVTFLYPKK